MTGWTRRQTTVTFEVDGSQSVCSEETKKHDLVHELCGSIARWKVSLFMHVVRVDVVSVSSLFLSVLLSSLLVDGVFSGARSLHMSFVFLV